MTARPQSPALTPAIEELVEKMAADTTGSVARILLYRPDMASPLVGGSYQRVLSDMRSLALAVAEAAARGEGHVGVAPADERLRTCGQHPICGDVTLHGTRACKRVLSAVDLYRCADCQTAFCRDCIRRHFRDETPAAREAARKSQLAAEADMDHPDAPESGPEEVRS